jgi:hypothetical protein
VYRVRGEPPTAPDPSLQVFPAEEGVTSEHLSRCGQGSARPSEGFGSSQARVPRGLMPRAQNGSLNSYRPLSLRSRRPKSRSRISWPLWIQIFGISSRQALARPSRKAAPDLVGLPLEKDRAGCAIAGHEEGTALGLPATSETGTSQPWGRSPNPGPQTAGAAPQGPAGQAREACCPPRQTRQRPMAEDKALGSTSSFTPQLLSRAVKAKCR